MKLTPYQKRATQRWTRSKADEMAVANGCWFDTQAATHVINFFKGFLRHSKGQWADEPFAPLKWQEDEVLRPLFGWKRPDGTRRYHTAYIEIPKKNGKSTLASGLSLYGLMADDEPGAEIYSAAATRDQASIVYREAATMVKKSPGLISKITLQESVKHMAFAKTNSIYKALSADAGSNEGLNIHFLIMDEMHAQRDDRFWNTLMYGGAARRQPLQVIITTAGVDQDSLCYEYHQKAMQIIEGTLQDDSFFAYVKSAEWAMRRLDAEIKRLQALQQQGQAAYLPPDMQAQLEALEAKKGLVWEDPVVWKEANPSLGQTISLESFREDFLKAKQSPRLQNAFKRYRLNLWTETEEQWLSTEHWAACGQPIDEDELVGQACYAGLDLASTSDLCALVLLFPDAGNAVLPFFWVPRETVMALLEKGDSTYKLWADQGYLLTTEGNVTDYDVIHAYIKELAERFDIKEIAIDRWNSSHLQTQLVADGFTVVPYGQGYASMNAPAKELERLILAHELRHSHHPVMTWTVANVAKEEDAAGNIKPSKSKSKKKIDGVVSLTMALGRSMVREMTQGSVYDTPGMLAL